jgi:hypothetical protein
MTPEWNDALWFVMKKAGKLGLEMAVAASPSWAETGGPCVKPEDAVKKFRCRPTETGITEKRK